MRYLITVFYDTKKGYTTSKKYRVYTKTLGLIFSNLLKLYYRTKSVYLSVIPKYYISTDLNYSNDDGRWVGYVLETHGNTFSELLDNVTIEVVDQDGGEVDCLTLDSDLDLKLYNEIVIIMQKTIGLKKKMELNI